MKAELLIPNFKSDTIPTPLLEAADQGLGDDLGPATSKEGQISDNEAEEDRTVEGKAALDSAN